MEQVLFNETKKDLYEALARLAKKAKTSDNLLEAEKAISVSTQIVELLLKIPFSPTDF